MQKNLTNKVWIEAALNGPWGREHRPGIPMTINEVIDDGVAAAKAGAAIIHVHAYDEMSGRQKDDWSIYAAIIEGIRAKVDAIVYPTIPFAGATGGENTLTPKQRFAHIEELGKRGLIEMSVVDPGSVNFCRLVGVQSGETGFVYQNSLDHVREGLRIAKLYDIHPTYAVYEAGFTRLGAAAAGLQKIQKMPLYRFMFSDEFLWGFPPRPIYLDAHLALLSEAAPGSAWMVAGLGVDIRPLIPVALARGGHIRVGLEDAPGESPLTNVDWVESAIKCISDAGKEPSTAAEVRTMFAAIDEASIKLRDDRMI